MKHLHYALIAGIVLVMAVLFVLTMFIPYAPAREEAAHYFSAEEIVSGLTYAYERRFFFWGTTAVEVALLCAFGLTSLGRRLADVFLAWTGQRRVLAAFGVGFVLFALHQLFTFPIALGRLEHAHHWGMSNLAFADWLRDRAISAVLELIVAGIVGLGFYALVIWLPRTWWLLAPLGGGALGVIFAYLMPIVILPLFNTFTPLSETKWHGLEPRVRTLIDKAEIPVGEILVMDGSRQSNHTNAFFAGFGSTRQIVLFDTLLEKSSPDEIDSVLAHEIGHWLHDHIVKGLLLGMIATVVGCFVLDQLLRRGVGRAPWNLQSTADPAGLPLVILLVFLGSWVTAPVQNALSRHFERQADQVALELAGKPQAFIAAEQNMARINLSNVAPTPWNVWIFSTHPTTLERIRMAVEWKN